MVDWSRASVTPRGLSVTEETLERTLVSEAAPRTPLLAEPSLVKKSFSAGDISFFTKERALLPSTKA